MAIRRNANVESYWSWQTRTGCGSNSFDRINILETKDDDDAQWFDFFIGY